MRDSKEFPYASHNTFEDQLIDQRNNWFLVSQAFLMAVFAVMLQTRAQMGPQGWPGDQGDPIPLEFKVIHLLLPLLGMGMAFLVYHSLIAAYAAKCFWRTPLYRDSGFVARERICQMSYSTAFPIAAVVFSGYIWLCLAIVSVCRAIGHEFVDRPAERWLYWTTLLVGGFVAPIVIAFLVMSKAAGLAIVRLYASSLPDYELVVSSDMEPKWLRPLTGLWCRFWIGASSKGEPVIRRTTKGASIKEPDKSLEASGILSERDKQLLGKIQMFRDQSIKDSDCRTIAPLPLLSGTRMNRAHCRRSRCRWGARHRRCRR